MAVSSYPDLDFNGDGETLGTYSISFECQAGGSVSGTVTDAVTQLPLAVIQVEMFDESGNSVISDFTGIDGTYSFGLPVGTYFAATTNFFWVCG